MAQLVTAPHEMSGAGAASERVIVFPPFRLIPGQRRLVRDGAEVELGGRALEILVALVERAGEILPKQELMARVWPDVTVDEGSLRFHMVALRKALGDDAPDRFIINVPGKGYGFVAPISREKVETLSPLSPVVVERRRTLPPRPQGVVGREQILRTIAERLLARRFVSIVGPGGIGKTTVALCVGHDVLAQFENAVHFVDLAQISDPNLVAGEIAASIGLIQYSGGLTPGLVDFLREKRLLLLVDNCEHVIGEAASVIERLIQEAPMVHVLATSREPLQVEGERVQRLFPLEYPPENQTPTAVEALEYPAVRYFVERATAATDSFSFDDSNAPLVAEICRQLDGVALALELAAGGVEAYGLQGTAALLRSQFTLPLRGKRTASPRQQTLRATLDWSYTLLSDYERIAIRRLAVFVGPFTIEAAESVVVTNEAKADFFVEALAELVSKSLVIAESESRSATYRLLATTRTYGLERLRDVGEFDSISRRHAIHFQRVLEHAEHDAAMLRQAEWLATYGGSLGDVRAALQWSFSAGGDVGVGIGIAGLAAKYMLGMSLPSESRQWSERARRHTGHDAVRV